MTIKIRTAALDDVNSMTTLNLELDYSALTEQINERLNKILSSDNYNAFVAEKENEVIGWLVVEKRLTLESGYTAEITGLIVSKNVRRLGVGKMLIEAAEQWALDNNLPRIVVRSNIGRQESHPFYLKRGYTHTKTSHNYEKRFL